MHQIRNHATARLRYRNKRTQGGIGGRNNVLLLTGLTGEKIMRKLLLAAALCALAFSPSAVSAEDPIVIKFSHVVAPNTAKGKGAEKFKELAERDTNGKVKVELDPYSTFYKDKEELEAWGLGALQMLAPSNSKFGPLGVREF